MINAMPPLAAFDVTEPIKADFSKPREVFGFLVEQMPAEIDILTTENYLYFSCCDAAGERWRGNLWLRAGGGPRALHFYYERLGDMDQCARLSLDRSNGLKLWRCKPFLYAMRWGPRTVKLRLNQVRLGPPAKARLRSSEVYVGPSYDESGLQFSLLFDLSQNCFLWILNEDEALLEEFSPVGEVLEQGERTQYVFMTDEANRRRVLVGVAQREIAANSYHDGPFDQLPDNFIATGRVQLRKYLELQNPDRRGQIDKFGFFKLMNHCRVAITPYYAYRDLAELRAITPEKFYGSLLKEVNDF